MAIDKYYCGVELLIYIPSLIAFILAIVAFSIGAGTNTSYLVTISSNWNTGAVINTTNSLSQCNTSGYSPFISRPWPGTVKGCYYTTMRRGVCNRRSAGRTFGDLPVSYKYWRGSPLCSSRVTGSYLDLSIAENAKSCPSNQRSCGKIDTLNNVLCVPNETACPMNYFNVIPNGQPLPSGFNYNSIPVLGATIILSNSNPNGTIVVELDASEAQPCADPNYKNYERPPYVLETFYENDKCTTQVFSNTFDPYYQLVDEYSYYKLYEENNILTLLNTYPDFPSYSVALMQSERTQKLYYKNYIGIVPSCINQIQQMNLTSQIIYDLNQIDSANNDSSGALLASLIFSCIGMFVVLATMALSWTCFQSEDKLRIIIALMSMIFIIPVFICSCIVVGNLSGLGTSFSVLADLNCVDDNLKMMLINAVTFATKVNSLSIFSLIFTVIPIAVFSFAFLRLYLIKE